MAQLLIRRFDDALHDRLKRRAAARGHSMEEEARELLGLALAQSQAPAREHIVDVALELFGRRHGVDLQLPPRAMERGPPDFMAPEFDDP